MTIASWLLFLPALFVVIFDILVFRRVARKLVWLEIVAFAIGGTFILWPDLSTKLARYVGIGRGADLLLYISVLWLLRESLLSRYHRLVEGERLTLLVRELAISSATKQASSR